MTPVAEGNRLHFKCEDGGTTGGFPNRGPGIEGDLDSGKIYNIHILTKPKIYVASSQNHTHRLDVQ